MPNVLRVAGAAMALATFATLPASAVELRILEWEGYISVYEAAFEAHAKANGKDIDLVFPKNPDGSVLYITNADDIFENVRGGKVDVVTPTHNYYKQERGKLMAVLHPIDTSRLKSFNDLYPRLRDATFARDDKGHVFGLPLLGGSYALAYNAAKTAAPDSWTVLLTPEAKGTYAVTSDQMEANIYQLAMLAGVPPAGVYDYDTLTQAQRDAIAGTLKTLVGNAASFWGGMPTPDQMKDLTYVTDYWFGVAAANKAGQNWKFADPKEGVTVWLDTVAISKDVADDKEKLEAAYMLVDYMLGVEGQATIAREFGSVIVNPKAKASLTPEQAALQPGESFFDEERFWRPLSQRTRNAYKIMWRDAGGKS